MSHDPYDDDLPADDDGPDAHDLDDDGETELVRCRACRAMIAEESPRCPHCGLWGPTDGGGGGATFGLMRAAQFLLVALLIGVILVMWHGLGR